MAVCRRMFRPCISVRAFFCLAILFQSVAALDMAASSSAQGSATPVSPNPAKHWNEPLQLPNDTRDGWEYDSFDCHRGKFNLCFRVTYKSTRGDNWWNGDWLWAPRYMGLKLESFQTWSRRDGFPHIDLYYRLIPDDPADAVAEEMAEIQLEDEQPVLPRPFPPDVELQPVKRHRFGKG